MRPQPDGLFAGRKQAMPGIRAALAKAGHEVARLAGIEPTTLGFGAFKTIWYVRWFCVVPCGVARRL